ncbi:MAG: hypothetical protein ACK4K6_03395 [Pseudarthrobacter sp.]
MKRLDYALRDAFLHVKQLRIAIGPHGQLKKQLIEFEGHLKKDNTLTYNEWNKLAYHLETEHFSKKNTEAKEEDLASMDIVEEKRGSESMSNDIHVEKFDISFPGRVLFKDASLHLIQGRKYGLIAPNGCGTEMPIP